MMWGVLVEVLSAVTVATMGGIGGWWLARRGQRPQGNTDERRQAREALMRVHEVASHMATEVGEHSSRVGKINQVLSSPEPLDSESFVQAVSDLLNANQSLEEQLKSAEERLLEQARQIECHVSEALTDALTELANRRAFDREMEKQLADFRRRHRTFCLALVDVDHFKRFNDSYGHQAGDEVLRGVAKVLHRGVREVDFVARYGGEEFAVICPGTALDAAKRLAERARGEIDKARFEYDETEFHVTASLGVAHSLPNEDAAGMIQRADAALYAAKAAGRNCVRWHDGRQVQPAGDQQQLPDPDVASSSVESQPAPPHEITAKEDAVSREDLSKTAAQDREDSRRTTGAVDRSVCDEYFRLPNRTAFCTVLNHRLAEWRRVGVPLSALLIRIDNYSQLVNSYGESAANAVLGVAARYLRAANREMDMVARYDTATFAVALPSTGVPGALRVAERMQEAIAASALPIDGDRIELKVRIGGSEAIAGDDTVRLLGRAEQALRAASAAEDNCSYFHNGQNCRPAGTPASSAK